MRTTSLVPVFLMLMFATPSTQNLAKAVDGLSAVARLMNWIAIEKSLMSDQIMDVSAELVGVKSGKVLEEMASVSVDGLADELKKVSTMTGASVGDLKISGSMVKSLDALSANTSECISVAELGIKSVVEKFKTAVGGVESQQTIKNFLDVTVFTTFHEALEHIQSNPDVNDPGVQTKVNDELIEMKGDLKSVKESIKRLADYQQQLKELLKLKGASQAISNIMAVVRVLGEGEDLEKLPAHLENVKNSVSSVVPIAKEAVSLGSLATKLENVQKAVEGLSDEPGAVSLTVGLPNKIEDMDQMLKDIQDPWIRAWFVYWEELEDVLPSMTPYARFSRKIKSLAASLAPIISNAKSSGDPSKLHKLLSEAAVEGAQLQNVQDLESSVVGIHKCVADLKTINTRLDFAKIQKVREYAVTIDETVTKLHEGIQTVLNSAEIKENNQKFVNLETILGGITNPATANVLNEAIKKIGGISDLNSLIVALGTVETILGPFTADNLAKIIKGEPEWDAMIKVEAAFNEAGLDPVLRCLAARNNTNPLDGVDRVARFVDILRSIDQKDIDHFSAQLGPIPPLKNALNEIKKATSFFAVLPKAPHVAQAVGRGVEVIRKMNAVFEKKSILVSAIDSFQTQQNWTSDKKEAVHELISVVEGLDTAIEPLMREGLLQDVFSSVQSVKGLSSADSELFSALISQQLAAGSNLQATPISSQNLTNLTTLQLDFTGAHGHLKAAADAVPSMISMFDYFFDNPQRWVKGTMVDYGSLTTAQIVICSMLAVGIIATLVGAGIVARHEYKLNKLLSAYHEKNRKHRKNRKNRDHHYAHESLRHMSADPQENLFGAIAAGNQAALEKLVDAGVYLDEHKDGLTPLHLAVDKSDHKMVRYLIENGANRDVLNEAKQTPEEFANAKLPTLADTPEMKQKGIETCCAFILDRQNGMASRFPNLMNTDSFHVLLAYARTDIRQRFKAKFGDKVVEDGGTHVVVKAKNGIYDIDGFVDERAQIVFAHYFFEPSMLVSDSWLTACLEDEKNFQNDFAYRVQKARINGIVYEGVDEWKEDMYLKRIPFLSGAAVWFVVHEEFGFQDCLEKMAVNLGAKCFWNAKGIRRFKAQGLYYHSEIKPRFIVYQPSVQDKINEFFGESPEQRHDYTVMTMKEFLAFVMRRKTDTPIV